MDGSFGLWEAISGGLVGIVSAVLMALGLKSLIDRLEASKVDVTAYDEHKAGNEAAFLGIQKTQERIESKLDTIIQNMAHRRGDDV